MIVSAATNRTLAEVEEQIATEPIEVFNDKRWSISL